MGKNMIIIKKYLHQFRHLLVCSLFLISFFSARGMAYLVHAHASNTSPSDITIVIDAGHGGADPGKVGFNNILEKDVNLAIAIKLEKLFMNKGFNTIMTRESDCDLSGDESLHRKVYDLRNRIKLIEDNNATIAVSIHQNSFPDSAVHGPQVFYYSDSDLSQKLATLVQKEIDDNLFISQSRGIKANSDYFLLKKSPTPTVIVECGFLSNPDEASALVDDGYQNKLIRAIYLGICNYLKEQ